VVVVYVVVAVVVAVVAVSAFPSFSVAVAVLGAGLRVSGAQKKVQYYSYYMCFIYKLKWF
jgi:hypothetical protein